MISKYPLTKREQSLARSSVAGDSWTDSEYSSEISVIESTHLQPVHCGLQGIDYIPGSTENAQYFQPEQSFSSRNRWRADVVSSVLTDVE